MAFRPPSLQKNYFEYSKFDPAFAQLERDANGDVDQAAAEAHEDLVRRCRETSDWTPLRVQGGGEPTRFELRQVSGHITRQILDAFNGRQIGAAQMAALFVRVALVGIVNLENEGVATPIGKSKSEILRGETIASNDVIDLIDAVDLRIVGELGDEIYRRSVSPSPRR